MTAGATTFLRRRSEMNDQPIARCHDGQGALDALRVLEGPRQRSLHLKFMHDDVLPPGASIGVHRHADEEYYYILEGRGAMTLDGVTYPVTAGDVAAVLPGGEHGLANDSDKPLRIIVVCAAEVPR